MSEKQRQSTYKDKIIKEIKGMPEELMPKTYNIAHSMATKLNTLKKKSRNRGSLKGIWKGSRIDESLFLEAKKPLFPL